ncbi:MAG: translational GTPase TypA [SAR324 cluster bacterium]|nr:translational GTPase TypA [SAR324 cluster bacterium]MEC9068953.1 translational GTPase TypA [SAR324 cluster bacterium]MED5240834.1 translational GTPase TypA [SAR324 cluster bacterium]MED6339102.1 translational GTPase TypA [SAR324 cluster bacterium]MEE2598881.1 translational GTPase TypA [SAR324 cluster bacterium]
MENTKTNNRIRNIAIIAHVDHGKTTLVDQMFRQSGLFRDNQSVDERIMDSMDLERERGITIAAKNCSVTWKDTKINILDTPGHADFGGEVERALMMVDGAILLVDSSEGPLPQTRFVLKKALEGQKKVVVVINKIDRQDSRVAEVLDEIYDLFIDLDATEDQLEFPVLFAIGRDGIAKNELEDESTNLFPLFDTILEELPAPKHSEEEPFQMLVADLDFSDYLGKLAIGRVANGIVKKNEQLVCIGEGNKEIALRASKVQVYEGFTMAEAEQIEPGEIMILAGIDNVRIGDTICTKERPKALKRISVDEPTISMFFYTNNSPFAGQEGKLVQPNKIKDRLYKETMSNVSLQFEETLDADRFLVKGRGELQMAVLIETMRREGFELAVGRPEVIYKEENGERLEPIEHLYVDCEEGFLGIVSEKLSQRKGRMINLVNHGSGRIQVQFNIPSRGLIGYRNEFMTDTRGTGIMNSYLSGYEPYRGDFPIRFTGSIVSDRQGKSIPYALFNLEPRGVLFITAGESVYEGMIIGEHNRDTDLNVNPCKEKKLTNHRASGKDENTVLTPIIPMTLERAIEFIREGEIVEVTPENIRLRKVLLSATVRHTARPPKA